MAVTRTSTGALFSSASSGTVTFGAGAAAGNLGILIVETANQAITTPTGWTLQKGGPGTGTGTAGAALATMLSIYTKDSITSGDISGGIAISDSGDHQNAVLLTYSGYDTTGRGIGASVGGSGLNIITPAFTSAATNGVGSSGSILVGDIVLAIIVTDRDSATISTNAAAAWNNIAGSNSFPENLSSATGAGGGIIVNELVPSGNSTGAASFNCSVTSTIMITCALQIFAPTVNQTLTPSLFTNTNSFFTPSITPDSVTLIPSLFTNTNSFFSPTVLSIYTLTPSLFTNSQSFFSPTVTAGPVTLTPSLFSNNQIFYTPTLSPGSVTITPNLFTNTNVFYSPTAAAGQVILTPSLFTNANTFYSPTVVPGSITLTPSLVTNSQSFYSPTVNPGVTTLLPSLFSNSQIFYNPTVTLSAGDQFLTPSLFTNTQTFFSPTVGPGQIILTPSLFTNSQSFFSPTVVIGDALLAPSLFVNSQVFYSPAVSAGSVTLLPDLFANSQIFYSPTVSFVVFVFVGSGAPGFARSFMKDFAS